MVRLDACRPGRCGAAASVVAGTLALGSAAAFGWFASGLAPFTWPARWVTGAAGAVVLLHARWRPGRRPGVGARRRAPGDLGHEPSTLKAAVGVWLGVVLALLAVEASVVLLTSDRSHFPTISSVLDPLLAHRPAQFVAYLVWLLSGVWLGHR